VRAQKIVPHGEQISTDEIHHVMQGKKEPKNILGFCEPHTPNITERYPPPYAPLGEVKSSPFNGAPGWLRR
jgi:hypothetical protein